MTSFLLVRHAYAPWSPDEMRSLSSDGELEADRLAQQLSALPITAVYSSPYRRSPPNDPFIWSLFFGLGLSVDRSLDSFNEIDGPFSLVPGNCEIDVQALAPGYLLGAIQIERSNLQAPADQPVLVFSEIDIVDGNFHLHHARLPKKSWVSLSLCPLFPLSITNWFRCVRRLNLLPP